ncbi:MAG: methylmalonyl-CoA mutase family protein, partial [Candidatus Neomarinimicrobiota bacterium]
LVDEKKRIVVGVNEFIKEDEEIDIPILEIGKEAEEKQIKAITELKGKRNNEAAKDALDQIKKSCKNNTNIMPHIIHAAKTYATLGEIVDVMKEIFGEWQESSIF